MDPSCDPAGATEGKRRKAGLRTVALRVVLVTCVPLVLIEGLFTLALHTDFAGGSRPLAALRNPWTYGAYAADDEHWEVRFLTRPASSRVDNPDRDDHLGWTCDRTRPLREMLGESQPSGQLPDMILVGDSYARGIYPDTWYDFESIAAASGLGAEYDFSNAGVGGYGFDQICLMAERELARRVHDPQARPVLLVSLLLDEDLDRSVLDFREWPKPRFTLDADGNLQLAASAVPTVAEYFDRHARIGPPITPWIVRKLLRKLGGGRHLESEALEKQQLARALLERVLERAEAAGCAVMFVLFLHSDSITDVDKLGWRLELVEGELEARGIPWVNVRAAFLQHMQRSALPIEAYFMPADHPDANHYNALGDAVAFQAILQGLKEHLGAGPGGNLHVVQDVRPAQEEPGGVRPRWAAYDERYLALGLRPPYVRAAANAAGPPAIDFRGSTVPGTIHARVSVLGPGFRRAEVEVLENGRATRQVIVGEGASASLELALGESDSVQVRLRRETSPDGASIELVLSEVRHVPSGTWVPPTK